MTERHSGAKFSRQRMEERARKLTEEEEEEIKKQKKLEDFNKENGK